MARASTHNFRPDPQHRLAFFEQRRDEMVATIRELVEIESPSDDKASVDRICEFVGQKFAALGGKIQVHRATEFGNHLQVDFAGKSSGKPVLLLGHYDTVYPIGTLSKMPCRLADGKLTGPGVLDMKTGIALMLHAIGALQTWHNCLPRPVSVLLVSDEEVGSDSSRPITESLAKEAATVLVLEPSYGLKGALKTARKGVGDFQIKVTGKAAHAGLDFEKGVNAILELARQIEKVSEFTELASGLTVSVDIVSGGTRTNVIPAEAVAQVDARISRAKDAARIEKKMRSLRPFNRKCKLEVTGGINRLPLERTPAVAALYEKAAAIARELGWKLGEASVGGGSDGNITAGLGIPTLDGLGAVGDGAHAVHEHILISELPRRAALIAGLMETV